MSTDTFGKLVKARRQELGLTQDELAKRVGCAPVTVRKIEYDDLRPSVQIAERLAMALTIPLEERAAFVRLARAERTPEPLTPTPSPAPEEIGTEDLTGRAIRGYALGERIGQGGMGVVYRAVQPLVEREVAVKIILPQYANHTEFIRRFEAEAQLVARLEHPHIVPLYDYWREPNIAFLVMRLLRGGSLRNLLEHGPLPLDIAARYLEQVGSALGAAHRAGVIHRDLKPANILLDEDQNAYLADFGIAKNLGNPNLEDATQVDAIIGSPAYISPEQIRSEFVRPQTDIYCLGVVLYELLTGHVPFRGPTPIEIMNQHLSAPLPPLAANRAGLPGALDAVIEHATAKDPLERYSDVESMLVDLRQAIHGKEIGDLRLATTLPSALSTLTPADNPYKGLRAFGEGDTQDFFGREALTQQLLVRMGEGGDLSRFLAVVGPSGSGKSSVVGAGLVPALRRGGLPGSENWFILDLLPGAHPFEEIEAALLRIAVNPPESLLNQLRENPRGLLRAVRRCLPEDPEVELVLVIDQFEEVFTLLQDEAERAHLLASLVAAALDERSCLRVVVTLRADFTDRPLQYVDFGELMRQRMEIVLPLTPDELELAIASPAERVGLQLEPGLVPAIVRDVGDQPGTLPLLQYALTELFEKREGNLLTKHAYAEIGGVLGALGRRAEEIYTSLDEGEQALARQLFLRLVTLGEGVEDTRRRVLRAELEGLNTKNTKDSTKETKEDLREILSGLSENHRALSVSKELQPVIEAYGKARLLTFDHDPVTRGPTVEVAHEALLREWPRLRGWLNESRADVRLQRVLGQASAEWTNAARDGGHDPGLLLRGTRLTQLEQWAKETTLALTGDERAFLEASLEARKERQATEAARQANERALEQRSRRFLRALVGVLAGATLIALFLSVFAFNQTRLATSRELAAAAVNTIGVDPELSVLLALQAVDTAYTKEAEDALHQTLPALQPYIALNGHTSGLTDIVFSPGGQRVATSSRDGTAKVWDSATGQALLTLGEAHTEDASHGDHGESDDATAAKLEGELYSVAFSPDGTRLATGGRDGIVRLWDAATGDLLFTLIEAGQMETISQTETISTTPISSVAFSPDGSRLAAAHRDGTVRVWDLKTQQVSLMLPIQLGGYDDYTQILNVVAFNPDGTQLATAGPDYTAIMWDAATGQKLTTLSGDNYHILDLAFSPDGTRLATAGAEVKVWDLASYAAGTSSQALFTLETGYYSKVKFSPDGNYLATSSPGGGVTVWDAAAGLELFTLAGHQSSVEAVAFSPDGRRLATASGDATARVWEAAPGRELYTLVGSIGGFFGAVWSPDGKSVAASGGSDEAKVWNAASGQEMFTLVGHTIGPLEGLAYSLDGKLMATGSADGTAKIWDATTGQLLHTLTGPTAGVGGVAFTPDGRHLATSGYDKTVRLWDVATGQELFTLIGHEGGVHCLAISPDGTRLVSGGDESIAIVWDLASQQEVFRLPVQSGVLWQVAYSLDGTRIATATGERDTRVYDATTGELLMSLTDFVGYIGGVAWSPDGTRIATSGLDAKIWDAATGELLLTLYGNFSGVGWLAFNPDGTRLVTGGGDGTARIYLLQLDELIALARSRVTRSLTTEECQKYLHLETCPAQP